MKNTKSHRYILVFLVIVLASIDSFSQSDNRSINKIGGFPVLAEGKLTGYFFSLDRESIFKNKRSFTHGPRLDYDRDGIDLRKRFPGMENLVIGYQFKFYPFHYIKQKAYQGTFIGVYPCYFTPINELYKNGPGLGSLLGYQYLFKDKISLSFEASVIYMQNVNEITPYRTNSQDRYFYITPSIKIGFKLGAAKKMSYTISK